MNSALSKYLKFTFTLLLVLLISDCSSYLKSYQKRKLGKSVYTQITESSIPWSVLGESVEGREIFLLELGEGDSTTLIFGGFHGSEISGVQLVHRFSEYLWREHHDSLTSRVLVVPVLNPDGLVKATRRNANGVDVNRNFPTANWTTDHRSKGNFPGLSPASELETQIVIDLLEKYTPQRIISVHAPLEVVNYDGPALELAKAMASFNKYPVDSDIGYATPGSFGTYAGKERYIPTITLELPRHSTLSENWLKNKEALLITLNY